MSQQPSDSFEFDLNESRLAAHDIKLINGGAIFINGSFSPTEQQIESLRDSFSANAPVAEDDPVYFIPDISLAVRTAYRRRQIEDLRVHLETAEPAEYFQLVTNYYRHHTARVVSKEYDFKKMNLSNLGLRPNHNIDAEVKAVVAAQPDMEMGSEKSNWISLGLSQHMNDFLRIQRNLIIHAESLKTQTFKSFLSMPIEQRQMIIETAYKQWEELYSIISTTRGGLIPIRASVSPLLTRDPSELQTLFSNNPDIPRLTIIKVFLNQTRSLDHVLNQRKTSNFTAALPGNEVVGSDRTTPNTEQTVEQLLSDITKNGNIVYLNGEYEEAEVRARIESIIRSMEMAAQEQYGERVGAARLSRTISRSFEERLRPKRFNPGHLLNPRLVILPAGDVFKAQLVQSHIHGATIDEATIIRVAAIADMYVKGKGIIDSCAVDMGIFTRSISDPTRRSQEVYTRPGNDGYKLRSSICKEPDSIAREALEQAIYDTDFPGRITRPY
jgi:hypothetical protein